tara:strand:+ start:1067 stop:3193 length:2127 start_codon:yes stop_codon:yes gene_type:complete
MLEEKLNDYNFDTQNALKNFALALEYEEIGQTASAIGLYLRCAEITSNKNLAYESLLRIGICYIEQGGRNTHVKIAYQNAISLLPDRPEGYNLMSLLFEGTNDYHEVYTWSKMGLHKCIFDLPPLTTNVRYVGKESLLLQEAVGAWYVGHFNESREKYGKLALTPNLDENIKDIVNNSLSNMYKKDKVDIVLQGPYSEYAYETAKIYINLDFVDRVILSCWEDDEVPVIQNEKITVLKNKYPDSRGTGNRNLQIVSSLEGLKLTTTEFVVKMRNDQRYNWDSMNKMKDIYEENKDIDITYVSDESKPHNKIFTAGNFPMYAFHPRDHIFWGHREDLIELFNIPLELRAIGEIVDIPHEDYWKYYDSYIRTESYIGAHYAAKFNEDVRKFLLKPQEYLYDNAPSYNQALDTSNQLYKQIFASFPREGIDLEWPKYDWWTYPYDKQQSAFYETWAEEEEVGMLNPLTVKEPTIIENYHDGKPASFYLYQSCPISACIRRGYIWEEHQHEAIDKYVNKDSTVVEVGAHVGTATIKLSKVAKEVHAFEPFKASYDLLNKNIKINKCKNVKVYSDALSDKKGKDYWGFLSLSNPGGSGIADVGGKPTSKVFEAPREKEYELNLITLDSLKLKKVDYIKIDVEGYEFPVLRGAMKTITKHKPIIVVESFEDLQHFRILHPTQVEDRFKDLIDLGYTYEYIDQYDFIFLPKGYKS